PNLHRLLKRISRVCRHRNGDCSSALNPPPIATYLREDTQRVALRLLRSERERGVASLRLRYSLMRLGILSDTHGNLATSAAGVRALLDAGAEYLIHCGDVGSTEILELLAGHPAVFVFGNTDWDRHPLQR